MTGAKSGAKSLFATRTFQGAVLGLVLGLTPIIVKCGYEHHWPTEEDSLEAIGLLGTFSWALIGRTQTSPVFTPQGMPGPNKSDFKE